jgi:hypothetical protein
VSETFLILRTTERDVIKNVYWSSCYSCQILMRVEISRQILEKYSSIIYHENCHLEPSCFMRTNPRICRETDRQENLVVAFHNFANVHSNGDERQHVALCVDISVAFDADY